MRRERVEAVSVGLLLLLFVAAIPVVILICTVRAVA